MEEKEENKYFHIKRGKPTENNNVKNRLAYKKPKKKVIWIRKINKRNDRESREDENMNINLKKTKTINLFVKKWP